MNDSEKSQDETESLDVTESNDAGSVTAETSTDSAVQPPTLSDTDPPIIVQGGGKISGQS